MGFVIGILVVILFLYFTFALFNVSGKADDQAEKDFKKWINSKK